mgnify:CR=1 FL=1
MTTARHSDTENSPDHLQRKLSNRHLQLIADRKSTRLNSSH